ncbi:4-O-methyltransferase 1 [Hypsizygus marmoreus]|uniref:4-O-methyltransferase 1 n=1 Tax=Hypsizygus marmoreus TaxID=39966 RepID=A0A369K8B5_HYPMA|nr:4-O-methyltransferase 1 [Hypsizygus marmoreus]
MTFAVLRALHTIIGDALDDVQRIYASQSVNTAQGPPAHSNNLYPPYASPPPSPSTSTDPLRPLDFPSLDAPYDPDDPAEQLTVHPVVVHAINKIVAAAGQMAATVQTPFLTLCDATLGYHVPSCMRLLEASHTVEMLREAGPDGLHVDDISRRNGVESNKLAHILRLLATHHLIRERAPNVFALNRISSLVDSGKSVEQLRKWEKEGTPEMKYHDTNGFAAFVGLNTDELQKSASYMTEAYLFSKADPLRTPFEFAFGTDVGYFGWLEGDEAKPMAHLPSNSDEDMSTGLSSTRYAEHISGRLRTDREGIELGPGSLGPVALGISPPSSPRSPVDTGGKEKGLAVDITHSNRYRLERFGKAMAGTGSWEAPGAVLNGFDWLSLRRGSIIVDVGGGIGSTSMVLANTFSRSGTPSPSPGSTDGGTGATGDVSGSDRGFKFIIQDRPVVVEMGEKAWRAKCPELLDSGIARFQVHDFFTVQPIKNAAVFFLRVILHDWPEAHARMILLKLREAATDDTKLVLADFVLPLACVDDINGGEGNVLDGVEGAESMLAPAPLLANLGKASANPYWLDMTMQVIFNAQERTLREIVALALSAGWKVIKVTHAVGSLFGHIVAVPVPIPMQRRARAGSGSALLDVPSLPTSKAGVSDDGNRRRKADMDAMERASSRCGTPTFGSRVDLPSFQDALARFGGGIPRPRVSGLTSRTPARPGTLKQAAVLTTPPLKKKKPSPLSFPPPLSSSPSPGSHRPIASPRQSQPPTPITRRMSQAHLHRPQSQQELSPPVPTIPQQPPPSPMSPRHPNTSTLARRASHAQLSHHTTKSIAISIPPSPSLPRQFASPSPHPTLSRRSSHAHLHQPAPAAGIPPSSIPVRQSQEPLSPLSPTMSLRQPPPPFPATSRHTAIPRRSSYAQLPQTSLRKRSGSIIGPSINGVGIGGGISMASLLDSGGRGGVLDFRDMAETGTPESEPMSRLASVTSGTGGSGSVLAAAARIERGALTVPPSP